ncbi:MAG: twin-arginine translocase TatA/TatE family subunit [Candidatus Margulisiibacteriota bacterium]
MFGLGGSEILVIVMVAVLLIKPEDLPIALKKAGELYGKCYRAYHAFLHEFETMVDTDSFEK